MTTAHILVVDDDPQILSLLDRYLDKEGFKVSLAETGERMSDILARDAVDLVLLDLVLGGEDGLALARRIREKSDIGLIILTGKGEMIDRIVGLEMGADDYVAKPFHLRELLARIKSVLRRSAVRDAPAPEPGTPAGEKTCARFAGWSFDFVKRELISPAGKAAPLTTGETNLLVAFLRNPNRVLDRDRLLSLIANRDWQPFDRSVDTQVVRLRRKIEADASSPALIKTVRGAGYIFAAPVELE
jgi:two-component system, OmpR family, response regulator